MWLMTRHGFFSIVEKPEKGTFHLRSRERRDLQNLIQRVPALAACGAQVIDTPDGDYAARILIGKPELDTVMAFLGDSIDYSNFKSRIATTPDQAHKPYHEVWDVMADALGSYGRPGTRTRSE
jgi:hypothetical protein